MEPSCAGGTRSACPHPSTGHSGSSSRDWSTPGPTRPEPLLFTNYHRSLTPVTVPFNIGVLQLSMEPVQETVAMAKVCEDAGFDTFWIAEAYPWWRKHSFEARSSTAVLAVIAAHTTRIQLGWGIISPYTRHPVQIAMEARVMQDLAGDRFLLGLGASKIFMKEIGEGEGEKVGPATVMRESIEIIRGVLTGDKFEYHGKVFAASVPALKADAHTSRKVPPVYVAGTGPAMRRLGGSLRDGLLTASIPTPAFVL